MIRKKCPTYRDENGEKNPYCHKEFYVLPCHASRKTLCDSCQKKKNNAYHKGYNTEWRRRNK